MRRKRINYLLLFLIISCLLLVSGVFMTIDAHYKRLSILSVSNQIEFLRVLPYSISPGETKKMPIYHDDILLKENVFLNGTVKADYYNSVISIRDAEITVKRGVFPRVKIRTLLDARSRN